MVYCNNCGMERHYPSEAHTRDEWHVCCFCLGCAVLRIDFGNPVDTRSISSRVYVESEFGRCKRWIEQNTPIHQATPKAPAIESLLTSLTGQDRGLMVALGLCVFCTDSEGKPKPTGEFKDSLSEKEYTISGMCQSCQDDVFDIPNVDGLGG